MVKRHYRQLGNIDLRVNTKQARKSTELVRQQNDSQIFMQVQSNQCNHRGLDTCCGGSSCITQAELVLSRADRFEKGENVSKHAADFSWPMHHPPCPFSFSVTTRLFAWVMRKHMKSPLSTAVFCSDERGPWGFCLLFIPSPFSQSFDFSRPISLWEVTLNVVGQTMWWKQNVMRRGRLSTKAPSQQKGCSWRKRSPYHENINSFLQLLSTFKGSSVLQQCSCTILLWGSLTHNHTWLRQLRQTIIVRCLWNVAAVIVF